MGERAADPIGRGTVKRAASHFGGARGEILVGSAARQHRLRVAKGKKYGLARFGSPGPVVPTPVLRSEEGVIFQCRRFRQACRDYRFA